MTRRRRDRTRPAHVGFKPKRDLFTPDLPQEVSQELGVLVALLQGQRGFADIDEARTWQLVRAAAARDATEPDAEFLRKLACRIEAVNAAQQMNTKEPLPKEQQP